MTVASAAPAFAASSSIDLVAAISFERPTPDRTMDWNGETIDVYRGYETIPVAATFTNNGPGVAPVGTILEVGFPIGLYWVTGSSPWVVAGAGAATQLAPAVHEPLQANNGGWSATRELVRFVLTAPLAPGETITVSSTVGLRYQPQVSPAEGEFYTNTTGQMPVVRLRSRIELPAGGSLTDSQAGNNTAWTSYFGLELEGTPSGS